jgi:hypothetical protein
LPILSNILIILSNFNGPKRQFFQKASAIAVATLIVYINPWIPVTPRYGYAVYCGVPK